MPSKATIESEYLRNSATDPAYGATNSAGVNLGDVPPAGHITRNVITGKEFRQLPTGGDTILPCGHLVNRTLPFVETFQRKPNINADLASGTEATREPSNPDFEIVGTNVASTCSAFADGGGVTLTTTTGSADQVIITPHLDTAQTGWAGTKWNTADEVYFETLVKTPATITSIMLFAGLKLTNTPVAATDDNQVFVCFDTANVYASTGTGSAANWCFVTSRAGVDTVVDTGVAVEASTHYHFIITVDQNRIPRLFINGVLVAVGNGTELTGVTTSTGALTDNIDLIPYIGVHTLTTAARSLTVRGLVMHKTLND